MASFLNSCRFTAVAGGTSDFTYASDVVGYQSPTHANAINGSLYRYRSESQDLTQWEDGYGIWNAGVLSRAIVLANSSATGSSPGQSGAGSKISFLAPPQVAVIVLAEDLSGFQMQARLTLTQGTAVTTSDVTGATSVFLEPYKGWRVSVYDGSSYWAILEVLPSTYSLPATQSQTGTTHTNTTIDGLTDTSQLIVGMQVTGTNVAANTTIVTIPTSASITVNNATTGSASNTMTFKLPPSTNYDIYLTNVNGLPKMLWSAAWSNDTTPPTRALQNGILVASGATTKLLLGSARTTSIAGQLEDSALHCWLSNIYNPEPRSIKVIDTTASWPWATAGWQQARANTANQADVLFAVAAPISLSCRHMFQVNSATPTNGWCGIGVDGVAASSATLSIGGTTSATANTIVNLAAEYTGVPGVGRHTFPWLEFGAANGTFTGSAGTVDGRAQSGLGGWTTH